MGRGAAISIRRRSGRCSAGDKALTLTLSRRDTGPHPPAPLPEGEGTTAGVGTVRWPRLVAKDPDCAESLKKRTLTNLYNQRPAWLDLAHRKLDEAVFAAYGWDRGDRRRRVAGAAAAAEPPAERGVNQACRPGAAKRRQSIARGVSPWDVIKPHAYEPRKGRRSSADFTVGAAPPGLAAIVRTSSQGLTPLAIDLHPSGLGTNGPAWPGDPAMKSLGYYKASRRDEPAAGGRR